MRICCQTTESMSGRSDDEFLRIIIWILRTKRLTRVIPVFDSFLRQKVSQTALLATCETFFYFYDCTLHYLFFCLGNNFFHFRYRYDLL